jgi:apolipoprotein N-acyltransferase
MVTARRLIAQFISRPRLIAPIIGALAACGFEPLHVWPMLLLGLGGLIALTARAPDRRSAVLLGWLWGVGHFSLGNNWIATAFTYQAQMPVWLGWIAVFGLSLYLAVYPALAALAAWHFRRRPLAFGLAFSGCWILAEWLRSWVFTGFAWNPLGVALLGDFNGQGLALLAPWIGTYGLSGVAVLLASLLCLAVSPNQYGRRWSQASAALLLALLAPMVMPATLPKPAGHVPYTLVQPNIAQPDIDNAAQFESQFLKTARLTLPLVPGQQRLVLWPESGVPDYLRGGYPPAFYAETTYAADPDQARARIARVMGPGGLLLTGSVNLNLQQGRVVSAGNVVTVLDDKGAIRGSYAKAHLVPYGEYLPLRAVLQPLGLSRLVAGSIDFSPGPGPRTLDLGPWGKAGIQICYEIIFSGQVVDRSHRPDYIFNPTNDGWFGSWGPPQHLAQARLRALEEGLPVLRSTTSGISAVIDADGIVRQSLPRFTPGRMDGVVPPPHEPTLFARYGNLLALVLSGILLSIAILVLRRAEG